MFSTTPLPSSEAGLLSSGVDSSRAALLPPPAMPPNRALRSYACQLSFTTFGVVNLNLTVYGLDPHTLSNLNLNFLYLTLYNMPWQLKFRTFGFFSWDD